MMTNRELETRYNQLKATWKNLVNANVELVDENKILKEENGLLKIAIIEARKIIRNTQLEQGYGNIKGVDKE